MNQKTKISLLDIDKISRKYLFITFLAFTVGIILIGYSIYKSYYFEFEKKAEDELTSVTKLKIEEINHWRKERIKNLAIYQKNESFSERVKKTLTNLDDTKIQKTMQDWMILFKTNYNYHRVCLHDRNGMEVLSTNNDDASLPHNLKSYFDRIFTNKEVVFEDFYIEKTDERIYLSLIVGVFDVNSNMPLGVLIARVDPEEYLYPLLNSWPIARPSAETYLVHKSGNDVVFLNNLKHQKNTALNLKFSIKDNKNIPAARAVTGKEGIYKGFDIENEEVISYLCKIENSPWYLVSKIDKREAMSPVRGILIGVISVVFLLISLLFFLVMYILRYQRYNYYKEIAHKAEELQQSEEALKILNETLEQKVHDRTNELELSNRELESFSYSVSHDLRAPLRHILGFADIMKKECESASIEANHYLKKIIESAGDMGTLIDDLLEYSRTGRSDMKKSSVDLDEIVAQIKIRFDRENTDRKIIWNLSDLPQAYCDSGLIQAVWTNLIENAVKYTSKKETASIEIGFSDKVSEFEFFIKDNGVGFDMTFVHKLFGVFQRLHNKNEFEGTGIGLANVKRIVNRHGGRIWAEGEVGTGAAFYFTLPKQIVIES